jgi:hypothetical protein
VLKKSYLPYFGLDRVRNRKEKKKKTEIEKNGRLEIALSYSQCEKKEKHQKYRDKV